MDDKGIKTLRYCSIWKLLMSAFRRDLRSCYLILHYTLISVNTRNLAPLNHFTGIVLRASWPESPLCASTSEIRYACFSATPFWSAAPSRFSFLFFRSVALGKRFERSNRGRVNGKSSAVRIRENHRYQPNMQNTKTQAPAAFAISQHLLT